MKRYSVNNKGYVLELFEVLYDLIKDYNWLITEIETLSIDNDYLFLSTNELIDLLKFKKDPQWIWGVFSAIPNNYQKDEVVKYSFPYANGNKEIWENAIIQHPLSDIEIIVFDSMQLLFLAKSKSIIERLNTIFPLLEEVGE